MTNFKERVRSALRHTSIFDRDDQKYRYESRTFTKSLYLEILEGDRLKGGS